MLSTTISSMRRLYTLLYLQDCNCWLQLDAGGRHGERWWRGQVVMPPSNAAGSETECGVQVELPLRDYAHDRHM